MTFKVQVQELPDGQVSVVVKTDHVEVVWITGSLEGIQPALEELAYLQYCKAGAEYVVEESRKFSERMRREACLFDG